MAKLSWTMLANYAEAPPGSGLVYIMGGGFDTITVQAPVEGGPAGAVAVMMGALVIRFTFHSTEVERDHTMELVLVEEDGVQVAKIEAKFPVKRAPGLPIEWEQGTNLVLPLTGMPLPGFGHYTFNVLLDGNHVGEQHFRVLKGY